MSAAARQLAFWFFACGKGGAKGTCANNPAHVSSRGRRTG
jgi:hypothetical protein